MAAERVVLVSPVTEHRTQTPSERQRIQGYYDDYSGWYDDERRAGYYGLINRLEFDKIRAAVTGRAALEIGCGTGLILERTHTVAARACGVDLSAGMVAVTRRKGLEALQASATALPFANASFDVVYSFKVLAHVPAIESALGEVRRVLRPDGTAFLEFYNPYSFKHLANRLAAAPSGGHRVFTRYDTLADVRRYLPPGFEIVSARGVRIFAPTHHFYTLPGIGRLFAQLETRYCDSALGRLGGYLVVELRAPSA